MSLNIKLKRSAVAGSAPTAAQLEDGELAVNYNNTDPALYIKDSTGAVVRIAGEGAAGSDLQAVTDTGNTTTNAVLIGGTLPASPNISLNAGGTAVFNGLTTHKAGINVQPKSNGSNALLIQTPGTAVDAGGYFSGTTKDGGAIPSFNGGFVSDIVFNQATQAANAYLARVKADTTNSNEPDLVGYFAYDFQNLNQYPTGYDGNVSGFHAGPSITFNTPIIKDGKTLVGFRSSLIGSVDNAYNFYAEGTAPNYFAGNVGIGTNDPSQKLQVASGDATTISIECLNNNTSPVSGRLVYTFDDGDGASINGVKAAGDTASDVDLSFRTGGITNSEERMRIAANGNVGIGTDDPTENLAIRDSSGSFINLELGTNLANSVQGINLYGRFASGVTPALPGQLTTYIHEERQGAGAFAQTFGVSDGTNDATERMRITSDGNVLIGGTLPSAPNISLNANGSIVTTADATINSVVVGRGGGSINSNTAIGRNTLFNNTTGSENTSVGLNALYSNTTGQYNTAIGRSALQNNTESAANTAVGWSALNANTDGTNNSALGRNALYYNLSGDNNTGIGQAALQANTTGNENTGIGRQALSLNTIGSKNTALGFQSLYNNSEGTDNTALGSQALFNNTTGLGNIQIGGRTSSHAYAPVFGITTQNDRIVMGSTSVTNAYVQVAWTVTSDARDKTNFAPVPYGLDFVKQLQPTAYQFKTGNRNLRDPETNELIPVTAEDELPSGPVRYGFKAQDILALEGDNPVIIDNEDPDHLRYRGEALVPVLVNAIQELTAQVQELKTEVAALKAA